MKLVIPWLKNYSLNYYEKARSKNKILAGTIIKICKMDFIKLSKGLVCVRPWRN
jgi:hypothetical protein